MPLARSILHPAHIAAISVIAVIALACGGWGGPAPHEDVPPEPVPIDTVLGVWEGG